MSLSLLRHAWRAVARSDQLSLASAHSRTLAFSIPSVTNPTQCSRTSPAADELTSRLEAARGAGAVLAVAQAAPAASARHMLLALRRLSRLLRAGTSEKEREELIKNPEYSGLCQNFANRAHDLEVDEAADAITVLTDLKVPVDSHIFQTMLQLIHRNIRNLSVQQIKSVDFIISQHDTKNPLMDKLKLELPLAFQNRLAENLNTADVPLLRDMLRYSCARALPHRDIDGVVSRLLQRRRDIDARSAKAIVWSLSYVNCKERFFPIRYELLHVCCDIQSQALPRMSYEDVISTAVFFKARIVEHHECYHERLMDAFADYVLDHKLEFRKAVSIARTPLSLGHPHRRLLEYLCSLVARTPSALGSARPSTLLGFIACLANSDRAPPEHQWPEIRRQISSNPILDDKHAEIPWLKICSELASLGHYEDRLLARAFSREYVERHLRQQNSRTLQLLALHEAVRVFHSQEYQLPEHVLQRARALYPRPREVIELMRYRLARALDAADAVARDVVLPGGIIADLLMCLQGGRPVSLPVTDGHGEVPVEDLNLPVGSLPVCIISFHEACFSAASDELRGGFRLVPAVLERQGFVVVPVNVRPLLSQGKSERGPWLLRQVARRVRQRGVQLVTT